MANAAVRQALQRLGFDRVGVSPVTLPEYAYERLRSWVAAGNHAELDYLAKRVDHPVFPEDLLPGARSVIVLALAYRSTAGPDEVSRYAWTRDYHKIIGRMLRRAERCIREEFDADARGFVDADPLLERAYAVQAGLGFCGRNSTLITPDFGSWVFLACLVTTLELEPDEAAEFDCGSCRRCVNACPTQALNEDGVLDARRCISYLTIENRDGIPEDLRPLLGSRIFGCDHCQDVCPKNSNVAMAQRPEFRAASGSIDLVEILALRDHDDFVAQFAGTPIMRAKRLGLLRNACVVAGNSGDSHYIPALEHILERESDPMLRGHAEWALARLKQPHF